MPNITATSKKLELLSANIRSVFLGKPEVVRRMLIGLLAGGHVLIEDVPGVGKTILARTLARSLDGSFSRIQFTPDLLPGDIIGVSIYDPARGEFEFKKGPVFANIILADEINRTTPRTQSSLLEAMSEGQVSTDGRTWDLPAPFLVIATQNPFEFEGTYPLPENQLDRFLLRVRIGYPSIEHEREILRSQKNGHPIRHLEPVVTGADVIELQKAAGEVKIDGMIYDYILDLANASRQEPTLRFGVSTRGSLSLLKAAQAAALLDGRDYVVPDDVKDLAVGVWAHRVVARNRFPDGRNDPAEEAINTILSRVACPA